jgi:hypothetical protein
MGFISVGCIVFDSQHFRHQGHVKVAAQNPGFFASQSKPDVEVNLDSTFTNYALAGKDDSSLTDFWQNLC